MGRFRSTWKIVRQSFAVLMQGKRLLFFPVVTSFLTVFVFLFFLAPIPFQPTGHSYLDQDHWHELPGPEDVSPDLKITSFAVLGAVLGYLIGQAAACV